MTGRGGAAYIFKPKFPTRILIVTHILKSMKFCIPQKASVLTRKDWNSYNFLLLSRTASFLRCKKDPQLAACESEINGTPVQQFSIFGLEDLRHANTLPLTWLFHTGWRTTTLIIHTNMNVLAGVMGIVVSHTFGGCWAKKDCCKSLVKDPSFYFHFEYLQSLGCHTSFYRFRIVFCPKRG